MRFMLLVIPKGYETAPADVTPDPAGIEKMMKYNRELHESGVLLAMDGLTPPAEGARVTYRGGKPRVTDGPFSEAKEVLGGFWMIRVNSREEAIEWAKRCPMSDDEIVEVRRVQDVDEWPADARAAASGYRQIKEEAARRDVTRD